MSLARLRTRLLRGERQRAVKPGSALVTTPEVEAEPESEHPVLRLQRTIGNQATVAYLQRQQEEGSATLISSAAAREVAYDLDSLTANITAELAEQPRTDDAAIGALEQKAGQTKVVDDRYTQHPSMAQMGIRPKHIQGFKVGIYIGNSNYNSSALSNLGGAKRDAESMKSTMEAQDYSSLPLQEDKTAGELDSILSMGVQHAKTFGADALLMYYAGHGMPQGLLGVDAEEEGTALTPQEEETGDRGIKLTPAISGIEPYTKVLQHLESSVANGVHTALIVDACHSGAGTDLFRDRAVERVSEKGNIRTQAITGQIARLEDLKQHISLVQALEQQEQGVLPARSGGASEETTAGETPEGRSTVAVASQTINGIFHKYWSRVVRPELQQVNNYLKEAGMGLEIPETLTTYSEESIHQQINLFINKLVDLAERIQQEEEESILAKAGG